MSQRDDDNSQHQHAPDILPLTSGNPLAPSHRDFDPKARPQRTGTILLTTVGALLLIALLAWLTIR